MHGEVVQRHVERDTIVELHELSRDTRLLGVLDQSFAPLRLLDLGRADEQRFEIAIFGDELCRGLDADAGDARHVVDRVARQRLHFDDLLGRHAEFLDHFGNTDAAVLHGVVHRHAIGHQLHQVFVGGHDGGRRAALAGLAHISRDQVVGLEAGLLEAGQIERTHRFADQSELRNEIVRRGRPLRLVVGIELVAERDFGLVEDDREVRRPVVRRHVAHQLPQHVAESEHGVDL